MATKKIVTSGLQLDVIHLYRCLLRSAKAKIPSYSFRSNPLGLVVKRKFRDDAARVRGTDFMRIEYLIRHGYKQKKLMEMPGFNAAKIVG